MQLSRFIILCGYCCVLAAAAASPDGDATTVTQYPGLEFIGQLTKEAKKFPEGTRQPTLMKYYISSEPVKWEDAMESCKSITKCQGHLVRIKDSEEDKGIQSFIPADKYGRNLWIDGVSDGTGAWAWSGTEKKMSYVHEGFGPTSEPTAHLAVMGASATEFSWVAGTDPEEEAHFLCQVHDINPQLVERTTPTSNAEIAAGPSGGVLPQSDAGAASPAPPAPTPAPALCEQETHLAIVIDRISTISANDLGHATEFARNLATLFPFPSKAFLYAYDDISQPKSESAPAWKPSIVRGGKPKGAADVGIEKLSQISLKKIASRLVVITTGKTKLETLAADQSARAKKERIIIYAIGIGPDVDNNELLTLVDEKPENVLMVPDLEGLGAKLGDVSAHVCMKT